MKQYLKQIKNAPWPPNDLQKRYILKYINWLDDSKIIFIRSCPCCKSQRILTLSKNDRFGLNFEAKFCKKCCLVFTSPIMKENDLPEYYSNIYHKLIFGKEEVVADLFSKGQGVKIYNRIKRVMNFKDHIQVFEVGAGGGNLLDFQKEAERDGIKSDIYGIEYAEEYVHYGKSQGVNLTSMSLNDYIQSNKGIAFDVIILSHVFEHVIDYKTFLNDLKKIMTDKSLLYIEVPGIFNINRNYEYTFNKYFVHAHTYHFIKTSLVHVLKALGFNCIFANEKVESIFTLGDESIKLKNTSCVFVLSYVKFLNIFGNIYTYIVRIKRFPRRLLKHIIHLIGMK